MLEAAAEPSMEQQSDGSGAGAVAGREVDGASLDGAAEHGGDAQDAPASSPPSEHALAAAPVARTNSESGACPEDSEQHPGDDKSTENPQEPSDVDESWMRPELDIKRLKKESPVEVRSDGEWWEAVIQDIDIEKNQIHVHYIGGSEDEDEWVPCEPQRVQLHPMIEILWAKVGDGPMWPSVVMNGSLRNPYCKKIFVFHLLLHAAHSVKREATKAFTKGSLPPSISDEKLQRDIEISQRAMQFGKLPQSVFDKIQASLNERGVGPKRAAAGKSARYDAHPSGSPQGKGMPGPKKSSGMCASSGRELRRKNAMRKLGLIPPIPKDS